MKKLFLVKAAVAVAALWTGTSQLARATLEFSIATGGTTTTVVDNGAGDSNPLVGQIAFAGNLGGFAAVITTGVSNAPGVATGAILQTHNISIRDASAGSATLTITMGDTGFTSPTGQGLTLASAFGGTFLSGTAGENVTFQSYADTGNTLFGTGITSGLQTDTLAAGGPFPASFSTADRNATFSASSAYSVADVTTIHLSASGQVNLSGTTVVSPGAGAVPEPASLSLLGMGAALLIARRRRAAR